MAHEPIEPLSDPEEEEGGPVKSFLEHLEDLRWVLIKSVAALLVGMTACLVASPALVKILRWPLDLSGAKILLDTFSPIGGFVISMKIAFYGGITLSLPFILYFIGQFIMPALKRNEKKYFQRAFIIGAGLFLLGILICYFYVLPISLIGMVQFNEWLGLPSTTWRSEDYFQFVIMFMVGMGLSFEVPVLILTLVRMGIIPHEWMVKGRSYFFVANLVICAFITPDAVSTIFMVIPVQILMEICILISKYWERQKRLAEKAAQAEDTTLV